MFARVTVFEDADPSLEEPFRAWSETVIRFSRELPGYLGMMTLIDPEGRRMIGLGLYDTAEHARKADELLSQGPPEPMPQEPQSVPNRTFAGLFIVAHRDGF